METWLYSQYLLRTLTVLRQTRPKARRHAVEEIPVESTGMIKRNWICL
jgi:hypothetical protein